MILDEITIENIRCFKKCEIPFSPTLNVFFGENGAGKTSILEAIFFLSRARTFRSGSINQLRKSNCDFMRVVAKVNTGKESRVFGVERIKSDMNIRIAGENIKSLSTLASCFFLSVINNDTLNLLTGSAGDRRSFLDWAIFQSNSEYSMLQRKFQTILKQRNALLKQGSHGRELDLWDRNLIDISESITNIRSEFLAKLVSPINEVLSDISNSVTITSIGYEFGWSKNKTFQEALFDARESDKLSGFTSVGPHRADIGFKVNNLHTAHQLSRGQIKITAIAIVLGQLMQVASQRNEKPLVLIDDLPSELDSTHLDKVLRWIKKNQYQTFLTSINLDKEELARWDDARAFEISPDKQVFMV